MSTAAVAAGGLLVLLAGHGVLRLTTGRRPLVAYGPTAGTGLCWFAGVALLGALTTLVGVLGGSTRPLPVLGPVLGLVALAGLVPFPARFGRPAPEHARPAPETDGPTRRQVRLGDTVAAILAVAVTVLIAVQSAGIPTRSNDEYAIWVLRARMLSQLGRLDSAVFADTATGYQHQEYPLFLPALFAWFDGWAGRPSDAAAHVAIAALVGATVTVAGAVLTRLAGPAPALVSLLLVLSLPTVLSVQSLELMADLPVFGYALCLALVLALWLSRPDAGEAWLAAAAVLAAGAIGTKAEGQLFAGSALLVTLALAPGRRRGVLVVIAAAGLVGFLPWQAYAYVHHLRSWVANGTTLSAAHLREVLPWAETVARSMVQQWPGGAGWGLVLLVALVPAAALAIRAGHGRLVVFVVAVVALDVAVLYAQYVATALGPPSDPVAARLLTGQLRVTVYRVALVPAALLALAVPVFAGLGLRGRPAPAEAAAEPVPAEAAAEPVPAAPGEVSDPGPGPATGARGRSPASVPRTPRRRSPGPAPPPRPRASPAAAGPRPPAASC